MLECSSGVHPEKDDHTCCLTCKPKIKCDKRPEELPPCQPGQDTSTIDTAGCPPCKPLPSQSTRGRKRDLGCTEQNIKECPELTTVCAIDAPSRGPDCCLNCKPPPQPGALRQREVG